MRRILDAFVNLYPLWIVLSSIVGICCPPVFLWFSGNWMTAGFALVMLSMGFTLTVDDFKRLFRIPGSFALGFACQYTVMPLLGWLISKVLNLEPGFAVGVILVASCPGGVASNLIAYLARANVALSVLLTMASTLTAFVMTPFWCEQLAGHIVEVDALGICRTTLMTVVAPVLIGVACNTFFPRVITKVAGFGPLISVLAIIMIAGNIVASSADAVLANAARLTLALTALHGCGFVIGYLVTRIFRFGPEIARTVSIEVGMQNGGMAAVLAKRHFSADPLVGVPAVFCSVIQTLVGSLIAGYWRQRPVKKDESISADRYGIYYWKCDRPAAFHGTEDGSPENSQMNVQLLAALKQRFPNVLLDLRTASGQGNHRTFRLTIDSASRGDSASAGKQEAFVRVEDGPERDSYFEVEARLSEELRRNGIPVPRVIAFDCAHAETPFAWQVLEHVPFPDLNQHYKNGTLALGEISESIGESVARWQNIRPKGFGPFSASSAHSDGSLHGLHGAYESYFMLNLQRHLDFLMSHNFFTLQQAERVMHVIVTHRNLLAISQGCLVHKDLALWNILGLPKQIEAFIDWDDAISGDSMDDISLLGCFHDGEVIRRALTGYARIRSLPDDYLQRFWLHLLRNMLVKAVIRVGAGYFERTDNFFLINSGASGADLEKMTRVRIDIAVRGLTEDLDLSAL